jgi:hypothetical protein
MKKLVIISLLISTLGFSGLTLATGQHSIAAPDPTPAVVKNDNTASMIDDIAVPLEVILYAQTKYQGSAITQARKVFKDGKQLFSLRVDNDTVADDYTSIYLLYDEKWQLAGEDKIAPPQPRKVEKKQPEPPKEEPKQEETTSSPAPASAPPAPVNNTNTGSTTTQPDNGGSQQNGGHGGGPTPTTTPTQ